MPSHPSQEVVSDWSPTAVEQVVLAPVAIALSPIYLGRQAYSGFHSSMSNFQTSLAERRRRAKYGDNYSNSAALLPPEIILQIFHLLRTRARFGTAEFFAATSEYEPLSICRYPRASRDLAAARLVCQVWLDAATEVLYTDVVLSTLRQFMVFADTLEEHPALAGTVRHLTLPVDLGQLHRVQDAHLDDCIRNTRGARWCDVHSALDRVFTRCTNVEDVTFFGSQQAVHGLMALLGNCTSLTRLSSSNDRWTSLDDPSWQLFTFNVTLAAHRLQTLQVLSLRSWALDVIRSTRTPGLLTLHTLRLEKCALDRVVLTELLAALPNLRVFEWRRSFFSGFSAYDLAATELLAAHLPVLTDCTFHCPRPLEYFSAVSIPLDDMRAFGALRTLSISGRMLQGLTRAPPCLAELDVVGFSPIGPGRDHQRDAVLQPAHVLRYRARSWREDAPALRHIRLWDPELARRQLRMWGIVAFLLREFLAGLDIDLVVNLMLKPAEEEALRSRFGRQEHIRRLLWKNVL